MGRKHGDPACWGHSPSQNAAFFKRLDEGKHCGQDWGFNLNAPLCLATRRRCRATVKAEDDGCRAKVDGCKRA